MVIDSVIGNTEMELSSKSSNLCRLCRQAASADNPLDCLRHISYICGITQGFFFQYDDLESVFLLNSFERANVSLVNLKLFA
jgi:hypothetical protein